MPIKFLNVPGSTNLRSSRPTGFKFPVGLTSGASSTLSVDYLVVAGGGSGARAIGGGGGGGGFLTASGISFTQGNGYTVTVGAGGPGLPAGDAPYNGNIGSNTTIVGVATAIGGGFGVGYAIGGNGGSGLVILRYPDGYTITFGAGVTGTESSASGGYKRATITAATSGNVSWS
jgi:hypothetical protein